jgi:hypothetical protein
MMIECANPKCSFPSSVDLQIDADGDRADYLRAESGGGGGR